MRPLASLALCAQLLACAAATAASGARRPVQREPVPLELDLRDAPRRLVHVSLKLAVQPGPLALVYPKWVPGEHGPTGPITDVASLQLRAGGQPVRWRRDDVDMYRIHLEVPQGQSELQASFDFISQPFSESGFSAGGSMTQELAILNWNQVLLVPEGTQPGELLLRPQVTLPAGWSYATALEESARDAGDGPSVAKGAPRLARFQPVSMEQLIDSPLLAGAHMATFPLGDNHGAKVSLAIAAESEPQLALSPEQLGHLQRLVAEEARLFGARHFERYTFLLALSDRVAHFGLEHHQSSDDRLGERALIDPELALADLGQLLAHESVHSWNGKHRRPAGLATPDYQQPMKGELLWVYEGLTEYLGVVLAARAGFYDGESVRDNFAAAAERLRENRGRALRPLEDTAVAAQLLYNAREDYEGLRRSVDFYREGQLIWLEADVRIREKTGGKRSLDDFCRLFFGGPDSGAKVIPYTLADVLAALGQVSPDDWAGFFQSRVEQLQAEPPLAGFTRAGWKLVASAEAGPLWKGNEKSDKHLDLRPSLGLLLEAEGPAILDVVPGSAADRAGVGPAMKLLAVNGKRYTPERLLTAVEASRGSKGPLVLLVDNADTFLSLELDYHGGPSYPHLERLAGTPDLLSTIFAPLTK